MHSDTHRITHIKRTGKENGKREQMKIAPNASPGASGVIAIADSLAGNDARGIAKLDA